MINLNSIFLKYDSLSQKDFLLSSIWIEYHLPDELVLLKTHGATDTWIKTNIYDYEEIRQGSGTIFYTILGENFHKNGEFIHIKSTMIINHKYYFNGYQTIIKTNKREAKSFNFSMAGKRKTLFYLTALWQKENTRTLSSLSRLIKEPIHSVEMFTEEQYKSIIAPKMVFPLQTK